MGQTKNRIKDHRTNIIVANFVRQQLKIAPAITLPLFNCLSHPVFEDEKLKVADAKSVNREIA